MSDLRDGSKEEGIIICWQVQPDVQQDKSLLQLPGGPQHMTHFSAKANSGSFSVILKSSNSL